MAKRKPYKTRYRYSHWVRLSRLRGSSEALESCLQTPAEFLTRHAMGDWGDLSANDIAENEFSIKNGFRLLSSYHTARGQRLWVITEAQRDVTTLLLPDEY